MSSSEKPLALNEVGPFGELSARPNPDGLVVLSIPPFETMLPFIIKQAGRELSSSEIEEARAKSPSIVVTKEVAEKMAAARAERS